MQVPKIELDLIEEAPGPLALGREQAPAVSKPPRGAARDRADDVQVGEQGVGRGRLWADRRGRLVGHPQHEQRVGQHEFPRGVDAGDVGVIEPPDLARAEAMWDDRLHEPDAVRDIGARQRHDVLHRRVGNESSVLHVLLDRVGERAHQADATGDPAHASIEASRQCVEREAVILMQRPEQPALLQRAGGRLGVKQLAKDQGVGFRHLPPHGRDRVSVQLPETPNAFVTVDDDVCGAAAHDDDRHLLAGVGERREQASLAHWLARAEPRIAQIQLMKFEVHRDNGGVVCRHSRAPVVPNRARPPVQLRTRPPTDDAALRDDPPADDRRHTGESAEVMGAKGTLIHHAPARAIGPLMVAMIQPAFRTVLMAPASRTHRGVTTGVTAGA